MKMYSKEGQVMVNVTKLAREGDDLVMTAKLMGAYSMKIYLRPEELREALKLLNWEAISYMPEMLITGTKSEDKLRELGSNLSTLTGDNLKLLLGSGAVDKLKDAGKAVGMSTLQGLVENLLLVLQIVLENK